MKTTTMDEEIVDAHAIIDEIGKNNVAIAKYSGNKFYITDDPKWVPSDGWNYLKYHKSWEWLMPVIEKICMKEKNIHYASWCDGSVFVHRFETLSGGIISQGISEDNIKAGYKAVVNLVKYLTENANDQK